MNFTSKREKRLWLWTLFVVLTIYSTLGLAQKFAGILQNQGLITDGFFFGMFLIGVAILAFALKIKLAWIELGVLLGILGVYTIVSLRTMTPGERSHMIEYSVVAALIYEALKERKSQISSLRYPWLLAILLTTLIGLLDECLQFFIPNRTFDLFDVGFNFLSAILAVGAIASLSWVRNWRLKSSK